MKKISSFKILVVILTMLLSMQKSAQSLAASADSCAIWICLPGGFPSGCGGALNEFKDRIRKGRNPLPELSGCTTGPNGETVNGSYQLGSEIFYPCDDGYVLRQIYTPRFIGICYRDFCAPNTSAEGIDETCERYTATRRPEPDFVKMWVDGEYIGQFFY